MKSAKLLKITSCVVLIMLLVGIVYVAFMYINATKDVFLDNSALTHTSTLAEIYDINRNKITYSNESTYTTYDNISSNIISAFVALEDKRFYDHNGIDYVRTIGAVFSNIKAGYFKEGGSTITQQLAKNSMLSNEKTYERKLKEWKIAREIESTYTKEEIIEMYLNIIYFGNGIYGIDEACNRIFNKTPSELNISESAMLAGIVKNPRDNSPLTHPQKATERMQIVLSALYKEGYINKNELETAQKYQYSQFATTNSKPTIYDYGSAVIEQASNILNINESELVAQKYKIYTYCDANLQQYLSKLITQKELNTSCNADIMAIVTDNTTGAVLGYVSSSQYSALSLKRQPASTIKPLLTYSPAIDMGFTHPASPVNDVQVDINGYSPQNYGKSYLGWIDLRKAVMTSSNSVALSLTNDIGLSLCKKYAEGFGLHFNKNDGLATALGGMTEGIPLTQLTEGYMTLANCGQHKNLTFISQILDHTGKCVYTNKNEQNYVISKESAYLMTDILIDNAKYGTAKKLASIDYDIASKTGTAGSASGNTDAICMSYTPNNTVGVWYGNNLQSGQLMDTSITGGSYPTLFTKHIYGYLNKPEPFTKPLGIIEAHIDTYATEKNKVLTLTSKNTPEDYQKANLFDANKLYNMPISAEFDNITPQNLSVAISSGKMEIRFLGNPDFTYKVYAKNTFGDRLIGIYDPKTTTPIIDINPQLGLNSYYITAETEEGIVCYKSKNINKFVLLHKNGNKKDTLSSAFKNFEQLAFHDFCCIHHFNF